MIDQARVQTVAICDREPVAIEGLRALLLREPDLCLTGAETSLMGGMEMVQRNPPSVLIVARDFGLQAVMEWVRTLRGSLLTVPVVWGHDLGEAEALRFVQTGAGGVIRKTAPLARLLACVRAVAAGRTWLEDALFENGNRIHSRKSNLTSRELQVLELVEQGLRNREIGDALGIQAGTVKIHMRHIFEKTGIRGRYGLALSGLKERGVLPIPAA